MEIKRFGNRNTDQTGNPWNAALNSYPLAAPAISSLDEDITAFKLHDHIALLYESTDEWKTVIVKFIATGIERGERCSFRCRGECCSGRRIKPALFHGRNRFVYAGRSV